VARFAFGGVTHAESARAPANTLIPVGALARPELLLEIEAVAEIRPASR